MTRLSVIPLILSLAIQAAANDDLTDPTFSDLEEDTAQIADTIGSTEVLPDSLKVPDTSAASVQNRYELFKQSRRPLPAVSYADSLAVYLLTERLNRRRQIDQSFYHDAGDYFRFTPSFFILEHQVTPLRKTVQPFGLTGDRLNFLIQRNNARPFEHIPEPDGLTDLNDLPTALDHDVYVLPGPMGQLFGGERSVATLLTRSRKPISSAAETALLADKGSFGYSNVRGRYSRRFADAREIDLSIGYRKGDGPAIYRRDDAYHYSGDIYFPVDGAYGVRTAGNLYDREGDYVVRPDFGGSQVRRERFDRSASISVDCHNSERSARGEFGYHHLRQGSYLSGVQKSRLNLTGHGLFALREWVRGNTAVKVDLSSDYLEYDDGFRNVSRTNVDLSLGVARWLTGLRWALTADAEYVESVGLLPSAAALLFRETDRFFAMLSAGYCEREASLLELHLPLRQSAIYGSAAASYTESGNSDLERERQLVANLTVEVGSIRTALALSLTGGKIFDGIDWQQSTIRDTLRVYAMFRPENGDVSFLDVAVQPRITIKDFARLNAGAAYHWLDYGTDSARPYTPTFQAFAGLELHVYWPQRLLHLYAYGEILYSDSYNGYAETALGEDPIANGKLSFAIKDFRMNFVFQNVFNRAYRSREHITFPGRYFYYGLTWSFLN